MAKAKRSKTKQKIAPKTRAGKLRAARNVPKKSSAKQRELERIEETLGEEFESLSEARKALADQTGPIPHKKAYSVKELSSRKHRTIKTFVTDLEDHTAEIDALKYDQDFWAAKIYGHGTYSLYGSIYELSKKLASYRGLQEEQPQAALKNIEIIRVHGVNAVTNYQNKKRAEVEARWQKRKAQHKLDRVRQRREKKALTKMQQQIKQQKATIRKLQSKLKRKK